MPPYIDQSSEDFQYRIRIDNLPPDITNKLIQEKFGLYGPISKLYLRRRVSKESSVKLSNPYVILFYENHESVDAIMASRPLTIKDHELFIRRCLPMTRRYPYEFNVTTNQILVRAPHEQRDQILPNNEIIIEYLKGTGGDIIRWERFEERTLFVEFSDYDPVDICCLSRPHFINDQMIEIEKCNDEQQARRRAQYYQKNHSNSLRLLSTKTVNDTTIQSDETISPTLALNPSEQEIQLASTYENMTEHIEYEHKQIVSTLKSQIEEIMKKHLRYKRLTNDYKNEQERLTKENRHWQKLYSESLREKPNVKENGERKLVELTQEYSRIKQLYDQL